MGCGSCGTCGSTAAESPKGCQNNGGCSSGGCNKMNTFDWISVYEIHDAIPFDMVEVAFKNGASKAFYKIPQRLDIITGDWVVTDDQGGYDIGKVTLSGELVRLQMKKKKVKEDDIQQEVIRRAHERDMEKLAEAREKEHPAMVKARAIARTMGLDMKIGDVEYRGDLKKATFYYIADGRVDFRELVRAYAQEFRVKIEMRQIGARQESGRIGGLGPCGRELCCSTWLTDFKSVSTSAARYQNLSINQTKLSGQCGRLKCCLNYELDSYMSALKHFPKNVNKLKVKTGKASLVKMDIFKKLMFYSIQDENGRKFVVGLDVERVKEIKEMNKKGEVPDNLAGAKFMNTEDEDVEVDFVDDVTGVVELPKEKKKKRGRRNQKRRGGNRKKNSSNQSRNKNPQNKRRNKPKNNKGNRSNNNNNNNKKS